MRLARAASRNGQAAHRCGSVARGHRGSGVSRPAPPRRLPAASAAPPRRCAYPRRAPPLPRPLRRQQATAYMLRATSAATTITCSIAILDTSEASRSPRGECRCRVCPASPCGQQYGTCLRARAPERAKPCSLVGREGRAGREGASARTSHPALNYRVRTANGRYQPPNGESHAAQSAPDPHAPQRRENGFSYDAAGRSSHMYITR